MLKIVLCADNHGDYSSIEKILSDNPCADHYFHLGDSSLAPEQIEPFVSIKGNNDWDYEYPKRMIFETGKHRILLMHGDGLTYSLDSLADRTRKEGCDTLFFGHTHRFFDGSKNGIRMINPGSSFCNRDYSDPCYAIVTIGDDGSISVERKSVW